MQNLDPKTLAMLQIAENSIASVHNDMLTKYIVETLLAKGNVNIEEAQFFNELSKKIISESSHLFIPNTKELIENIVTSLEEDAKVLVDPETGDKFVYYPDTGELTPATDEDVAGLDSDGDSDDLPVDDEADNDDIPVDDNELAADAEDPDADPASQITDNDEDVSASAVSGSRKKGLNESKEEVKEVKEELNENSLLVKQLLSTLKEL